jgi:hypothetical protein
MEVERFIQPLGELERETLFWSYNHAALAIFVNRENCYVYRLPEIVRNQVVISETSILNI